MRKTITYSSIVAASLLVSLVFVTSKTYTQLGVAVLLYPTLVYFAIKVFPRKIWKTPVITVQIPSVQKVETEAAKPAGEHVNVSDIDKRAFLKLIGAAGISFFLFSLFGKRAEGPFFGKLAGSETTALKDIAGNKIDPAERQPLDGYQISEIDDNMIAYYGFTNKNGAWLIMREETDATSFRYTKGDSEFPGNWNNREKLSYDYYHNVF